MCPHICMERAGAPTFAKSALDTVAACSCRCTHTSHTRTLAQSSAKSTVMYGAYEATVLAEKSRTILEPSSCVCFLEKFDSETASGLCFVVTCFRTGCS